MSSRLLDKFEFYGTSYQNEDLQEVQWTRFATGNTALIMSLQLVPGQNLN